MDNVEMFFRVMDLSRACLKTVGLFGAMEFGNRASTHYDRWTNSWSNGWRFVYILRPLDQRLVQRLDQRSLELNMFNFDDRWSNRQSNGQKYMSTNCDRWTNQLVRLVGPTIIVCRRALCSP